MKQTRHHLADIIGEKTLNVVDEKQLAKEVAAYLLHEHQTGSLESLVRDIMQYRTEHGVVEAITVSSSALTDEVLKDVKTVLKQEYPNAKSYIVRSKIDEDLVGGVRIDLSNEQLDLSVKAKLSKFKRLTALERNNV